MGRFNLRSFAGAQEWAKKLGLKVVLDARFPKGETEFRALLERIRASGAEAIVSNSGLIEAPPQLRQLRELNINVKMFAALQDAQLPEFIKELGGMAEYVVGHASWLPKPALGYPGIAEFIENYEKRYGETPENLASEGYAAMQVFVAAVKKAGSFDPEKIRDALASMTVQTIRGVYRANEQGMSPMEVVAFQIQNGKRLIVWPELAAEGKLLLMPRWEDRGKK